MTVKVAEGRELTGHRYFLSVVHSNNMSVLHRFQDTTFTVYMTACDFEMSFSFDKTVKITGHVFFLIYV